MKIASAQIKCTLGEIEENLDRHVQVIEQAILNNVQLISFPEMSITGYCRKEGVKLAFTENDSRLNVLKKLAQKGNIIIIASAPIKVEQGLFIGSFIIHPEQKTKIYSKQNLHGDEALFYSSSKKYNPIIQLEEEKICLAICADINHETHLFAAKENGCTIYLPGIFFANDEMDKAHNLLQNYATKYDLNILMSNYSGEQWGIISGGESAFWNSKGQLIDALDLDNEGILIAEKKDNNWTTEKLTLIHS